MTGLLLKLFVKNYKDTAKSDVRENVGKMSSIVGIVLNVLLASAKVIVGALFGALSVLADNACAAAGRNLPSKKAKPFSTD